VALTGYVSAKNFVATVGCSLYIYVYIYIYIYIYSRLLSKNLKIKIYRIIILPVFFIGVKLGR